MRRWWILRDSTWLAFVTVLVLPFLQHGALSAVDWLERRPSLRAAGETGARWRAWRRAAGPSVGTRVRRAGAAAWPSAALLRGLRATAGTRSRWFAGPGWLAGRAAYWIRWLSSVSRAHELTLRRYGRRHLALRDSSLVITGTDQAVDVRLVDANAGAGEGPRRRDPADLVTLASRLCLVGAARSGPSRILERLFWEACAHAAASPRGARLPVVLDLATVEVPETVGDHDLGAWLYRRVRVEAERTAVYRLHQCYDASARGAGLLVLLDGLGDPTAARSPRIWAAVARMGRGLGRMSRDNVLVVALSPACLDEVRATPDSVGSYRRVRVVEPAEGHRQDEAAPVPDASGSVGRMALPPGDAPAIS